jgi:diguanylate cyclase (GGDEF)-like protein
VTALPSLTPGMSFDDASAAVVGYLKEALPLGFWSVTRCVDDRQVYLAVRDDTYGNRPGDFAPWSDTLCQYMLSGAAPQIAPDAMAVPVFAAADVASRITIGAYVGVPITLADGQLFGTLCGFDPLPQGDELLAAAPLLQVLTMLLSTVLDADLQRTEAAREMERVELESETDALTGLYNRRGWDRILTVEDERYRRFGDPASVIILDLDRLKTINDTAGHEAGDTYLRLTADTLRGSVRDSDVLARLGGDEFGVIAVKTTAALTATLLERLDRALARAGVSGSFGHAPYTITAGFAGAWRAADAAMYAEKSRRRVSCTRRLPRTG